MLSDDKTTEIYCLADDFCKFFDETLKKHSLQVSDGKLVGDKDYISKKLFHELFSYGIQLVTKILSQKVCLRRMCIKKGLAVEANPRSLYL